MSCCGIEHFAETHTRYLLGGCDAIMQNSRSIYSSRPSATCPAESLTCATRAEIILQFCATRDKLELPNAFRRWASKNDAEPFAPQAVFFQGYFSSPPAHLFLFGCFRGSIARGFTNIFTTAAPVVLG